MCASKVRPQEDLAVEGTKEAPTVRGTRGFGEGSEGEISWTVDGIWSSCWSGPADSGVRVSPWQ